jgi:hypothetical protein
MTLIKLIERSLTHWGKAALSNELHIKEPSPFELEQAIARAKINGIDTIIVYRQV